MIMELAANAAVSLAINTACLFIVRSRFALGIRVAFVMSISCLSSALLQLFMEINDNWTFLLGPLINVFVFLPIWMYIGQSERIAEKVRKKYLMTAVVLVSMGVGLAIILLVITLVRIESTSYLYGYGVAGAVFAVYLPSLVAVLILSVCWFHGMRLKN